MKPIRKIFLFEYNEGLGEEWLNINNLRSLLHSNMSVRRSAVQVKEITNEVKIKDGEEKKEEEA